LETRTERGFPHFHSNGGYCSLAHLKRQTRQNRGVRQILAQNPQQYDSYEPFPGVHINGKQTLAENIADLARIAASYDSYHASLGGKTALVQDGFSGDQQFFIAFGQNYASKLREALLRRQVLTDPHSPRQYRTSTVRNIDGWHSSFEV